MKISGEGEQCRWNGNVSVLLPPLTGSAGDNTGRSLRHHAVEGDSTADEREENEELGEHFLNKRRGRNGRETLTTRDFSHGSQNKRTHNEEDL